MFVQDLLSFIVSTDGGRNSSGKIANLFRATCGDPSSVCMTRSCLNFDKDFYPYSNPTGFKNMSGLRHTTLQNTLNGIMCFVNFKLKPNLISHQMRTQRRLWRKRNNIYSVDSNFRKCNA